LAELDLLLPDLAAPGVVPVLPVLLVVFATLLTGCFALADVFDCFADFAGTALATLLLTARFLAVTTRFFADC
jgi:hypothetical protein